MVVEDNQTGQIKVQLDNGCSSKQTYTHKHTSCIIGSKTRIRSRNRRISRSKRPRNADTSNQRTSLWSTMVDNRQGAGHGHLDEHVLELPRPCRMSCPLRL